MSEITSDIKAKVLYAPADLSCRNETAELAKLLLADYPPIDILVHAAGGSLTEKIVNITDSDWDSLIELNLSSAMVLTRGLARHGGKKMGACTFYLVNYGLGFARI